MKKFYLLVLLVLVVTLSFGQFIENKGQIFDESGKFREDVHFVAQFSGENIYFTSQGVVHHYRKIEPSMYNKICAKKVPNPYSDIEWKQLLKEASSGNTENDLFKDKGEEYRIDMTFPGAKLVNPIGEKSQLQKNHYYLPTTEVRDVAIYEKIRYKDAYPGIDLVFYTQEGNLKYDFELAANANPSLIKILYKGHKSINIDKEGNVVVETLPGNIIEHAPISFQDNEKIKTSFKLIKDTIVFAINKYNKSNPITIDPALTWSTYFHDGNTSGNFTVTRPVWDASGNMFVALNTYNRTTFPLVNPGGSTYYNITPGTTGIQLVIMKYNTSRQIVWSTYYPSNRSTRVSFTNNALVIDQSNNIYVAGKFSNSGTAGPYTMNLYNPGGGAYYESDIGAERSILLKFSSAGVRLWATMFDSPTVSTSLGSHIDIAALAIDNNNKLIAVGEAYVPDGSWQPIPLANPGGSHYYRGSPVEEQDPTIHRFSASGVLEWGTYISQGVVNTFNSGYCVDVGPGNNIFVAGGAGQAWGMGGASPYTLVNPGGGAYQDGFNSNTNNGRKMAIFKFASNGSLNWNTLYGGSTSTHSVPFQNSYALKVNSLGDVYVVGTSNCSDFPTFNPGGGAYMKTTISTGGTFRKDGVILKFSNGGVRRWATFIGGNGTSDGTELRGIAIDGSDNITVSGGSWTTNTYPTLNQAGSYYQASQTGANSAAIISQFSSSNVMLWSTYFGNEVIGYSGGFGGNDNGKYVLMSIVNGSYSVPTVNPGGGAYYQSAHELTATTSDFIAEFSSCTPETNTTSTSTICETSTKALTSSGAGGGTWSVVSGGGTISGTTYTPANITVNTTVTVRYTDACGSTSDRAFLVNYAPPLAVNSTSTAAICEGSTKALTSSGAAGGTWSVVSGGGTISGSTYTSPSVAANTSVTVRYAFAANGVCPGNFADVTFTVTNNPGTASNTTSNAAICETTTKALVGSPSGGTWSVVSGGGTISGTTYTSPSVAANTSVTVRYTIAANGGCPGSTSDVVFTVSNNPGAASNTTANTSICETTTKALTGTPSGGTWSVVSGGGTISGSTYTAPSVAANTTVTVRYTIAANGGCAATTSDVAFTVTDNPGSPSNTTSNAAICEGSTKALTATPSGGTWSVVSGGGTISGSTYTSPSVAANTSVTIRYTVAPSGCPGANTSDVVFTVNDNPGTASNTTTTTAICELSTKALVGSPSGGTWSVVSGGGTISGSTYTAPSVAANTSVTVRYTIAANGACAGSTSDVVFVVNDNPGIASNTTTTAAICEGSTKALTGTPGGGTWSVVSGGGTISGSTYTSPGVAANTSVTVRYTIAANGSCAATTSDVIFVVNDNPGTANNTTSNAAICELSTKALSGTPGGGTWSVVSGGGTISGTTYTSPSVAANTSVTVRYTIAANGSCAATTSDVVFTVNDNPGTANNTTSNAAICEGSTKTLVGSPSGGTWSVVSGGGTISGTTYTSPSVSANTSVTIRYTIAANGSCAATTSDVVFTVNDNPGTASNTTTTTDICELSTKALAGSPSGGTWSVVSGGGTIIGSTYTAPSVAANTSVTVRYTIAANGACAGSTSDVVFLVNDNPVTASNTTTTTSICETATKALTGTPSGGTWSVVSGGGTIIGTTYTPPSVVSNTSVTVRYTIAANGSCAGSTSDATFTVEPNYTTSIISSGFDMCVGDARTLVGSPTGGTFSVLSGGAFGSITGNTLNANAVGTVQIRYRITNACGNIDDIQSISIVSTSAASITSTTATMCIDDLRGLTATPLGGSFSVIGGPGYIGLNDTLTANASGTVQVEYRYISPCGITADTVSIVVNPDPVVTITSSNTDMCIGGTRALTGTPASGTWAILSGPGSISGSTLTTSAAGTIQIEYTASALGCTGITTQSITVLGSSDATWVSPGTLCETGLVDLTSYLPATSTQGGFWSGSPNVSGGGILNTTGLNGTTINVKYKVGALACQDSLTLPITIVLSPDATWSIASTICEGQQFDLDTLLDPSATTGGTWSGTGVTGSIFDPYGLTGPVTIKYVVSNASCSDSLSLTITNILTSPTTPVSAVNDSMVVVTDKLDTLDVQGNDSQSGTITIITAPLHGTAIVNANGEIEYASYIDFTGNDVLSYEICDAFCSLTCDTAYVYIKVEHNVFDNPDNGNIGSWGVTPNGDGINDVLLIDGLYEYPDNQLTIYNRWGDEVFSAKPYNQDWDGSSPKQVVNGTYFFILEIEGKPEPFKGFIHLQK